jgi:hypothetical protein
MTIQSHAALEVIASTLQQVRVACILLTSTMRAAPVSESAADVQATTVAVRLRPPRPNATPARCLTPDATRGPNGLVFAQPTTYPASVTMGDGVMQAPQQTVAFAFDKVYGRCPFQHEGVVMTDWRQTNLALEHRFNGIMARWR